MEVYEYEKSLLTRLEESLEVLNCQKSSVLASQIPKRWSYYVENFVQPTGWQAIWKIPRVICEELKIRYPTCVYGNVDDIVFDDLKAIFSVIAVEDDIGIPETHEVNLIDLCPTKLQENDTLDADKVADCLDKLRFFYNYIWMPWDIDADNDIDWTMEKIESRIRFCYDLKKNGMKRPLAAHIRMLITEARYIQSRREYLELDLSDTEDMETSELDTSQTTDLMRLHLRLNIIKSELEILENPEMRKVYEDVIFNNEKHLKHGWKCEKEICNSTLSEKSKAYIVTKPCTFDEQFKILEKAKSFIDKERKVQMCRSLQDVLTVYNTSDQIYLPPGPHAMKFLEYFNDGGLICGLSSGIRYDSKEKRSIDPSESSDVIIVTQDDESNILIFNGDFTIKNLVLDCRNARCGAEVKSGNIVFENCLILGDGRSSTRQGLTVGGEAKLELKNCMIKDLATGILIEDSAKVSLNSCTIFNCTHGVEIEDGAKVELDDVSFVNAKYCGIYYSTNCLIEKVDQKKITYSNLYEMRNDLCEAVPWTGNCSFENNYQNIVVFNRQVSLASNRLENLLSESIEHVGNSYSYQLNGNRNDEEVLSTSSDEEVLRTSSDSNSSEIVVSDEESIVLVE